MIRNIYITSIILTLYIISINNVFSDEKQPIKAKIKDRQIAYIFINPIVFVGYEAPGASKPQKVLPRTANSRTYDYIEDIFISSIKNVLEPIPDLKVRTYKDSRTVSDNLNQFKNIENYDKITLIAIKNKTGIDGLIYGSYGVKANGTVYGTIYFVDLNNGRVFTKRELNFPISSELFNSVEQDAYNFGKSVRASYSVVLEVEATPKDAKVLINGKNFGSVPKTIELDEGKYKVEIVKDDYKSYQKEFFLKEGEKVKICTNLYNPIADNYLNRAEGFRIDRWLIGMGYSFCYIDNTEPEIPNLNLFMLYFNTRIPLNIDIGFMMFFTSFSGKNKFDTFLNRGEDYQTKEGNISEYLLNLQWSPLDKFSFASVHVGGGFGFSRITSQSVNSTTWEKRKYSWAGNSYIGAQSVLIRAGSVGFAVRLDVGYNYFGELEYQKVKPSLFGQAQQENKNTWIGGFYSSLSFDFIYWNGIF